jgi:hypothetical protein
MQTPKFKQIDIIEYSVLCLVLTNAFILGIQKVGLPIMPDYKFLIGTDMNVTPYDAKV